MANADIRQGYKDATWFTANPTLILKQGQRVNLEQTGTYKLGDGITQLSALSFLGGSSYTLTTSEIGSVINAANSATPNDTDLVMSVESSVAKKNTWTQIKAFLKTYFDTIYTTTSDVASQITIALTGYVQKGTLTNNYIQKATSSSKIGNSPLYFSGSDFVLDAATKLPLLTANQVLEVDSNNMMVSVAKGTAYNKNFGTTTGTVLEGDRIVQTITNGVTNKAPSEDAVFDALGLKLTAANNLSDLANPLTARNNLKEWDLRITTGNQSTTSNVATNITDLVSPTLTANKLYDFEGHIYTGCNNTGGVKFQITLPSGATLAACFDGSIGTNATFQSSLVTASATLTGFSFVQFNGSNIIKVKGQVLLGGTTGTIQFGFASNVNTQTSTVYQLGTHITLRQLD